MAAPTTRVTYLDGLRAIAVALVLAYHFLIPVIAGSPGSPGAYAAAAIGLSFTGVDLFFVLSGFLIGGILIDHRTSSTLYRTFYIRRLLRIVPLAYLLICLAYLFRHLDLFQPSPSGEPFPIWSYLFFLSNFSSAYQATWGFEPLALLWTLALEEQFYAVAPWLVRFTNPETLWRRLVWLIIGAFLLRLLLCGFVERGAFAAHFLPFCRMDSFAFGMLAAWLARQSWWGHANQRVRRAMLTVVPLAILSFAALTKLRVEPGSFALATWGYTAIAASYALLILLLNEFPDSPIRRLLSIRIVAQLGRTSYFMYLFQGLVIGLTVGLGFRHRFAVVEPASMLEFATGVAALGVVASLSWKLFEVPMLGLAHRIRYEP